MVLKPKIKILHKINIHSSKATVNLICSLNDFSSGRAGATKLGLVLRVETDRGSSRLKSKSWKKIKDEDEGVYNNFSRFVVKSFFVQIFFVGLGEKKKKRWLDMYRNVILQMCFGQKINYNLEGKSRF